MEEGGGEGGGGTKGEEGGCRQERDHFQDSAKRARQIGLASGAARVIIQETCMPCLAARVWRLAASARMLLRGASQPASRTSRLKA